MGPVVSRVDSLPLLHKGGKWIIEKRSVSGWSPTETSGSVEDLKMNKTSITVEQRIIATETPQQPAPQPVALPITQPAPSPAGVAPGPTPNGAANTVGDRQIANSPEQPGGGRGTGTVGTTWWSSMLSIPGMGSDPQKASREKGRGPYSELWRRRRRWEGTVEKKSRLMTLPLQLR